MCSSPTLADSKYVTRLSERGGGADEKKKNRQVRAAIFLPSKLDLVEIFALALCLRGCSLHTSRGKGERRKKKYIYIHTYIYMLVQSSFFSSQLRGSRRRSRHYCLGIC